MGKKQIQKTLNIFTKRVKTAFHPEQVLLFGSYGYGKATDYSDVDVVVVAEKFRSMKPEKRLDVL